MLIYINIKCLGKLHHVDVDGEDVALEGSKTPRKYLYQYSTAKANYRAKL